jgi:hypothetical protein
VWESFGNSDLCELKALLSSFHKLSRIFVELQSNPKNFKAPQSFFEKLLESYSFAKFKSTSKGET